MSAWSTLHIGSLNIRSVNRKSATVSDLIATMQLDVLAMQETWHENIDSLTLQLAVPPGYCVIDAARDAAPTDNVHGRVYGGGVAVIYRAEYRAKKLTTLNCRVVRLSSTFVVDLKHPVKVMSLYCHYIDRGLSQ